jgi:hypothetical protein
MCVLGRLVEKDCFDSDGSIDVGDGESKFVRVPSLQPVVSIKHRIIMTVKTAIKLELTSIV